MEVRLMSLTSEMHRIAKEDINDIVSMLNEDGFKTSVVRMESDPEEIKEKVKQSVHAVLKIDGRNTDVDFDYEISLSPETVYIQKPCEDIVSDIESSLKNKVSESTRISKSSKPVTSSSITAADDDFESDDFSDETDPTDSTDSLSDNIDDIADTVEDIQDTIDDVQEDDVNIQVENNISDHYIAECERCHGIFISSVIRSEQPLEKISGTCPLCDRQTDQYLKWVVKDVKDIEE